MKQLRINRKEQECLMRFFKEQTTWCPEHLGYTIAGWFLMGSGMFVIVFPWQAWEGVSSMLWFQAGMLLLMGSSIYMFRYDRYKEDGKSRRIGRILAFLPVSKAQWCIFRMRKLLPVCLILTAIGVVCQCVFALIFYHEIVIWNLCEPLFFCFVLPVGVQGLEMLWDLKRDSV